MRSTTFLALASSLVWAQTRSVPDPGVVTTRQAITPAGIPTVFQARVHGLTFDRDLARLWVASQTRLYLLDWKENRVVSDMSLERSAGLQTLAFDAAAGRPLVAGVGRNPRAVDLLTADHGRLVPLSSGLGMYLAGALAIAAGPRLAVVPLTANNQLAVVDVERSAVIGKVATGIAPFGAVISRKGEVAFVSNWGGRVPRDGDRAAPAGPLPTADRVVVDERGVASTGTVSRIDVKALKATHTIEVGLHPTALAWDEPNHRLYVANGNSDSISVLDTERVAVAQTFAIEPFAVKAAGIAPTALALSSDRKTLYAACGGINAIAVLDAATGALRGLIPTAWYPNGLALSPDGRWLAVSALLGVGPGWREAPNKRYVHADRGTVAVIPIPDSAQLASYTAAVAQNNRMQLPGSTAPTPAAASASALPIPARSGDPSPIEHVVFIIKENRTYDQVFGDIPKGNGEPSLVMFGRDVTPNQHKLAEQFVLLDNYYATGGNSADGHQWITQANETDYCLWPGYAGRSYPFDGTDPIAYSKNGFLWDYALACGKSVRVYGEYAGHTVTPAVRRHDYLERWRAGADFSREWNTTAPIAPLNRILAHNYPAYTTSIPDAIRADIFLADVRRMEKEGSMPNLMLVQLPSDHTNGTAPRVSTPKAMVADNDAALGRIVEGLTRTSFWPRMAIFVTEDDAQNGVDHVDGHRTVALAISPYSRRGYVDSTFYSTQSMVKTIELILGLPTMSLFDLIAEDLRHSFQQQADTTPYTAVPPVISLFDENPAVEGLAGKARDDAIASSRMRFDVPDAAPTERLNRILWRNIHGTTPYPGARQAVFAPLSLNFDDESRSR